MATEGISEAVLIPEWTDLKSLIDANPKFRYDHVEREDVNELIIRVRQSNEFTYYTKNNRGIFFFQ